MRHYIIADNQELTQYTLQTILKQDERNSIFRTSNRAGLAKLLNVHEDAIVILDFTLFDFPDVESLVVMSERFAMASWILVSEELNRSFLEKVIYASHAFSVVMKNEPIKSIKEAIRSASDGKRYVSQQVMERIFEQHHAHEEETPLTATEIEIVKAIANGKTTKEIANERYSSVHTITTHRKNIFRKLGINTAHEAVKYAFRAGWVNTVDFTS